MFVPLHITLSVCFRSLRHLLCADKSSSSQCLFSRPTSPLIRYQTPQKIDAVQEEPHDILDRDYTDYAVYDADNNRQFVSNARTDGADNINQNGHFAAAADQNVFNVESSVFGDGEGNIINV